LTTVFFKKYDQTLHALESGIIRNIQNFEIWTIAAYERELEGTCLADMIIDTSYVGRDRSPNRLYKHQYRLKRSPFSPVTALLNEAGHLSCISPIVVSSGRHIVAAVGFVISLDPDAIVIRVDQPLPRHGLTGFQSLDGEPDVWVFRIDLEDSFLNLTAMRNHLLRQLLFVDNVGRRLRGLVVDLEKPRFPSQEFNDPLSGTILAVNPNLSPSHQQAVKRLLCAQDFALLRTNKDVNEATIVDTLIHAILEADEKILLVDPSHEMLDTHLSWQMPMKHVMRLGNPSKVRS
jgi:DNA replication ATP-dependent helicase Dna2